jgi:hypothetical protein
LFNPVLKYWKSHLWAALNRNHLVEESISDSQVPHVPPPPPPQLILIQPEMPG